MVGLLPRQEWDECSKELDTFGRRPREVLYKKHREQAEVETIVRHGQNGDASDCKSGRTSSLMTCSERAKRRCFGPVSGLEVRRTLTPEKPWLTLFLPSTVFNWLTRGGAE